MSVEKEANNRTEAGELSREARRWFAVVIGVVAAVVLFFELGDFRSFGSHETYAVVPAREMLESGDWVVPRFGELPRLRKPPLVYWVLAGTGWLCGELNHLTARLPSALAALGLALLVGRWAWRWYGPTAGLGATLAQLTAVWVLIFSRKAEVDILLCLLTTGAMYLFAQGPGEEPRRARFARWAGIYGLLSLSWLAKFHYGPAMVLGVCVVYWLTERRYRDLLNLANPAGLLMLAAAVFIWPWLLLQEVPGALGVWQTETVGRAVGSLGGQPVWYYVPYLFSLALPWTPVAAGAVPASWRRAWKEGDRRERLLWVWLLTQLAIVTISADKHKHYLFASLPMISLLAGRQFGAIVGRVQRGEALLNGPAARFCAAATLIAAVAGPGVVATQWPPLIVPAMVVGLLLGLGGPVAAWLVYRGRAAAGGYAAAGLFLCCYMAVIGWIVPGRDHRLATAQFAAEVRSRLAPDEQVWVYEMGEHGVVYYLRSPVRRVEQARRIPGELVKRRRMLFVTHAAKTWELRQLGALRVVERMQTSEKLPPTNELLVLAELTATEETAALAAEPRRVDALLRGWSDRYAGSSEVRTATR